MDKSRHRQSARGQVIANSEDTYSAKNHTISTLSLTYNYRHASTVTEILIMPLTYPRLDCPQVGLTAMCPI